MEALQLTNVVALLLFVELHLAALPGLFFSHGIIVGDLVPSSS
jgi:hypothetical protein